MLKKTAVILAGGKGTRLQSVLKNTPKALVKIGNKPIIEYQIILLRKHGIEEIWILLGHLGDKIRNYLGDGEKWKMKINYCQEKELLGTAGALKQLEGKIKTDFLVLSGDIMLDFDISRFINFHKEKRGLASLVVHPSDHPLDSDLVKADKNEKIITLLKRPHDQGVILGNLGIASVFAFSPKIIKYIPKDKKTDFERDILSSILSSGEEIYAYNTSEYIKDIGTPERLEEARSDYFSQKISAKILTS